MSKFNTSASFPRGGKDVSTPWWVSLRQGLQLASQLLVSSPVKLPAKVLTVAKYVSLALGIWQAVEAQAENAGEGSGGNPGDDAS